MGRHGQQVGHMDMRSIVIHILRVTACDWRVSRLCESAVLHASASETLHAYRLRESVGAGASASTRAARPNEISV